MYYTISTFAIYICQCEDSEIKDRN